MFCKPQFVRWVLVELKSCVLEYIKAFYTVTLDLSRVIHTRMFGLLLIVFLYLCYCTHTHCRRVFETGEQFHLPQTAGIKSVACILFYTQLTHALPFIDILSITLKVNGH